MHHLLSVQDVFASAARGVLLNGAMAPEARAWEHEGPGWYGEIGYDCYDASYCAGNLKAFVGLPVEWNVKAHCAGGSWYMERTEIATGSLPPGLYINDDDQIVGVPERAGNWHLRIRIVGFECGGNYWDELTHDLHITTEGSSAPRSVN